MYQEFSEKLFGASIEQRVFEQNVKAAFDPKRHEKKEKAYK